MFECRGEGATWVNASTGVSSLRRPERRGRGTGKGEGRRGGSSSPVTGEEGDGDADSWV